MEHLLNISGVSASADEKPILHGVDLAIDAGECHVLMGPNGAGKSTLGHVIMGDPVYRTTSGTIGFDGADLTDASPDKRSLAGIFLSYQAPVEIPGVPLYSFLRTICQKRPELKMTAKQFRRRVGELCEQLDMDSSYLTRELNVGFSGGEKKKVEMLQLLLLQPKLAILDETDSGLDVDAVRTVSKGVQLYRERVHGSLLIITHSTRILEALTVDAAHIMEQGVIVKNGDASLVDTINENGFGGIRAD